MNYAKEQFHSYVKNNDIKQQILLTNPVPENLNNAKKLDEFLKNIRKGKHKQEDVDQDATFEEFNAKTSMSWDHCQNSGYLYKMLFRRRRKKCQ